MTGLATDIPRRPTVGLVVLMSLTLLAFASYASGFRAAGFAWIDAAGAAFAYSCPVPRLQSGRGSYNRACPQCCRLAGPRTSR